jgi:hypothetical protein
MIHRHTSPPSSGSNIIPIKKPAETCRLLLLASCLSYFSTLKLEAIYSSERSGSLRPTRCYSPKIMLFKIHRPSSSGVENKIQGNVKEEKLARNATRKKVSFFFSNIFDDAAINPDLTRY